MDSNTFYNSFENSGVIRPSGAPGQNIQWWLQPLQFEVFVKITNNKNKLVKI